ncbi:hypothetical protein ACIPSE_04920 [Streptomyces sp. NPDC090106]|uniref:hypothetical protein n=1 Tax=Streptomyces sp. NPDC090106 TaxID=3365946 RepID=UPI00380A478A
MLDLTVRLITWMLSICAPVPRGRHRLDADPPLRFIPVPPPRFAAPLVGPASRTLHPDIPPGIDIGPKHIHGIRIPAIIR